MGGVPSLGACCLSRLLLSRRYAIGVPKTFQKDHSNIPGPKSDVVQQVELWMLGVPPLIPLTVHAGVPFIVLVAIMLGIGLIALDPPTVLFGIFCVYGLSGYVIYAWCKSKGRPVSVISTSTDEPDERGLHQ